MMRHISLIAMVILLAGCYRDAGDGETRSPTTSRDVSVQNVQRTPSATPTREIPTFTPAPERNTPTLRPSGPDAGDDDPVEDTPAPAATDTLPPDATEDNTISQPGMADTGQGFDPTPTPTSTSASLPTPTPIPEDECIYYVVEGDTLSGIAEQFDISQEEFVRANESLQINPNSLQIAQPLRIPGCESEGEETTTSETSVPADTVDSPDASPQPVVTTERTEAAVTLVPGEPIRYLVQPGDNLFRIALRYNTTVEAIMQANNLTSDIISSGDVLIIPQ